MLVLVLTQAVSSSRCKLGTQARHIVLDYRFSHRCSGCARRQQPPRCGCVQYVNERSTVPGRSSENVNANYLHRGLLIVGLRLSPAVQQLEIC